MRGLAANLAWVAVMVILFFAALFYMVPSVQAATCAGQWITTSWYGQESGNRTADGSYFDGSQMYAASRTMKFGTRLRLTYRGRSAIVTVRDRGPAAWTKHDLDISRAAAERIGLIHAGVGRVCVEQIR